jgi:hypothetical protein
MHLNADLAFRVPSWIEYAVILGLYFWVSSLLVRYKRGLRSLPGPFLATFTNLWRLVDVARGHHHDTLIGLHQKYQSKLVRVGPNVVSVADPGAVRIIYGLKTGFTKACSLTFYVIAVDRLIRLFRPGSTRCSRT